MTSGKQRGRLSREVLVRRALAVADREGLDAVTIRRVAGDCGVTPMALYWYFRDKEQLLAGIAEYLFEQVQMPSTDNAPWDAQLMAVLSALLTVLRQHSSVAGLIAGYVLSSEAGLRVTERVLGLLRDGGFPPGQAAVTCTQLVAIIALITGPPGPDRTLEPQACESAVRARLAGLSALDPARFPSVIAAAAPLARRDDDQRYYRSVLQMLVGGAHAMAAQLAERGCGTQRQLGVPEG